jgi:hypothetical protein
MSDFDYTQEAQCSISYVVLLLEIHFHLTPQDQDVF